MGTERRFGTSVALPWAEAEDRFAEVKLVVWRGGKDL